MTRKSNGRMGARIVRDSSCVLVWSWRTYCEILIDSVVYIHHPGNAF